MQSRIRRDAGNAPDEATQLTCDGSNYNLLQLTLRHHVTIALAQPGLRLPGNFMAPRLRPRRTGGDSGPEQNVAEEPANGALCSLDEQGPDVDVAGLGDGTDAALRAGGMLGWHQTE